MSTVAATTGDLDVGWPELVSRLGTGTAPDASMSIECSAWGDSGCV